MQSSWPVPGSPPASSGRRDFSWRDLRCDVIGDRRPPAVAHGNPRRRNPGHGRPRLCRRTLGIFRIPTTLREQVIAPILANVHSPKMGRKPAHWTRVDRDYERIRIDMQTLFTVLAIETPLPT